MGKVPPLLNGCPLCAPKVIVCAALLIVTDCVTCGAALKLLLPAWSAASVQVPAVRMVTVVPLKVQTAVVSELYVTASVDDAVASGLIANVPPALYVCAACAPNVMVWLPLLMTTLC